MSTPLIIGLTLLLLALTGFWALARTRRIRAAEAQREEDALARLREGDKPFTLEGDTVFEAAGLPSRMPERRGIEVAEHGEVVDLEALLAGEPQGVARRARATLEEPTNIALDTDTLPPRAEPPAPVPAPAQSAARPAMAPVARPAAVPAPAVPTSAVSTGAVPSSAAASPVAAAAGVTPGKLVGSPPPAPVPAPAPVASPRAAAAPRLPQAVAALAEAPAARASARPPQPSPPTLVMRLSSAPDHASARGGSNGAGARSSPASMAQPDNGASMACGNDDVPLRELALAWFEARGYRSAPASAAVRPIEQVLRHRHDPARAYAFVVENERVTADRVQQLRAQARSIGLLRVLIVANQGADDGAATKSKGVRLMDRDSLGAEFDQLDFSVAAKIIAVARKRSSLVPSTVH